MLTGFFMICAIGGGAFILAQVLLSALAIGAGHGLHLHHAHGPHLHGHAHAPAPKFAARGAPSHHAAGSKGISAPRSLPSQAASTPGAPATASANAASRACPAQDIRMHWASAWLHGLFTFQGMTAGAAVLGLAGLAATSAKLPATPSLAIALGAALVMMAIVAGILELMSGMEEDGTVRLEQALGQLATVYLSIPARNQGLGKISITLQQQVMEFPAVTSRETPLATGQKVIVVAIQPPAVMEVVSAENYLHDIQT